MTATRQGWHKTTRPCVGPRAKEEDECGASTSATAWGGNVAISSCNTVATGWDGVPVGDATEVTTHDSEAIRNVPWGTIILLDPSGMMDCTGPLLGPVIIYHT